MIRLPGSLPSLIVAALAAPCAAHDLWLVPPPALSVPGVPVRIELAVGMDFPVSVHGIDPERVTVRATGPGGQEAEVTLQRDEAGMQTFASFTPAVPGAWLISAVTLPNRLELPAGEFNDYLLHDGMPHVLAGRMDRNELERPATERYSKFVKALVPVQAEQAGAAAMRALGLELEILPLADPLAAAAGEALPVEVRFRGSPLEHANLCWDHPGNGADFSGQTWTDAQGRALVPLARPGLMTLRLVHMTRPLASDHEWASYWASCTFRVRAGAAR